MPAIEIRRDALIDSFYYRYLAECKVSCRYCGTKLNPKWHKLNECHQTQNADGDVMFWCPTNVNVENTHALAVFNAAFFYLIDEVYGGDT